MGGTDAGLRCYNSGMIAEHQPVIFPKNELLTGMSSIEDGNMRFAIVGADDDAAVLANRKRFLENTGLSIGRTELVYVTFDSDHFTRFRSVSGDTMGQGMEVPGGSQPADGLATTESSLGLFLPLADCNGLILYDQPHHALMVVHVGRHSTIEDGAKKAVGFMSEQFGTRSADVLAWLSPAVGKNSYAMEAQPSNAKHFNFVGDNRWEQFRRVNGDKVFIDLSGYNRQGLIEAGLLPENIEVSDIDTATDPRYPSHSSGDLGRYAIVAALR